jgi:hypothetical protein
MTFLPRHLPIALLGAPFVACSSKPVAPDSTNPPSSLTANHTRLLGDMKPIVSVKELNRNQ